MNPPDRIRVYVVDDHPVVAAGIAQFVAALDGVELVGGAGTGERALPELEGLRPDVLIVDYQLGSGMSGVDLCALATRPPQSVRCLALTASLEPSTVQAFVDAGALGFLLKRSDLSLLEEAVRTVFRGDRFLDPELANALMGHLGNKSATGVASLSAREREVLQLVASGMSNPEIATLLRVSLSSVKGYVGGVLRKLGARHRAEAAALAARAGIFPIDGS